MPPSLPLPPRENPGAPGETAQGRLGRLRIRSMRRGIREMDLILQDFADRELAGLAPADLDAYEALLGEPDGEILQWITEASPAPERHAPLVARIRAGAVGLSRPD